MKKLDNVIILKSNIINALLPKFSKHIFYNSLFFAGLYLIYFIINKFFNVGFNTTIILSFIFLTIILSMLKITKELIIIHSTTFEFYPHRLDVKYKLFNEKIHSVNYINIADIQTQKTIWDRICGVGDVIIHTTNDDYLDEKIKAIILKDVKHADQIKEEITKIIHQN